MRNFFKNYGLLIWLSLILIVGYALTIGVTYMVSRSAIQQEMSQQTLPIVGDNLVSEIKKIVLRPALVSSEMAHSAQVSDWINGGVVASPQISNYLKDIKQRHAASSVFIASAISNQYLSDRDVSKELKPNAGSDAWFYRLKNLKTSYETVFEPDLLNNGSPNVTIYYRINDAQGAFIGVSGFTFSLDTIKNLIDAYQKRYRMTIYFVDANGDFVFGGSGFTKARGNLSADRGISEFAAQIVSDQKIDAQSFDYQTDNEHIFLNTRFVPELGWHLMVEQEGGAKIAPVRETFMFTLIVDGVISFVLIAILLFVVRRYQRRIEQSAATDSLTTLMNRHAFDFVFKQTMSDRIRTRQPMCVALIDIDFFKKINDKHGHLVGDHVLKEISMIAKRSLRDSDVICRWGGEEFLILLKNCTLEKATSIAETLRTTIAANDFSRTTDLTKTRLSVTVSMGVAECKDDDTEDSVFERADVALYQAKNNGRNSVYFSE
jgi:diguanylate cyclase (GGDEF)-like protein